MDDIKITSNIADIKEKQQNGWKYKLLIINGLKRGKGMKFNLIETHSHLKRSLRSTLDQMLASTGLIEPLWNGSLTGTCRSRAQMKLK